MKDVFCLKKADAYKGACIGNFMLFLLIETISFLLFFDLSMDVAIFYCGFIPAALFCRNLIKYIVVLKSQRNDETIKMSSVGIVFSSNGFYKSLSWEKVKKVSFMVDRSCRFGSLIVVFYYNNSGMVKIPIGDYAFSYSPFLLKYIIKKNMRNKRIEKTYRLFLYYIS